jgi:hypothetical protein
MQIMVNSLTPAREARRASIKGLVRITLTGNLDKELVEDIVAVAPQVQILNLDILENTSVNTKNQRGVQSQTYQT